MDIWKILDIDPTTDRKIIKKAYLAKLKATHPEEKPKEFEELRKAYELALEYKGDEEISKSEFIKDLENIYFDFESRINIDNWIELFKKHIDKDNTTLENLAENKSNICREELLVFLMTNYFINTDVWKLIDRELNIVFDKNILSEKFPPTFISFIVARISNGGLFNLNSIEINHNLTTRDYDDFIEKSLNLYKNLNHSDLKDASVFNEIDKQLKEIELFGINNISNETIRAQLIGVRDGVDAQEAKLISLLEKYKENNSALKNLGIFYFNENEYIKALETFEKILEKEEDSLFLFYKGYCLFNLKEYEKALEIFDATEELEDVKTFVHNITGLIFECSKNLVDTYIKENEDTNYSDPKKLYKLAKCYSNTTQFEEVFETISKINEEDRDVETYSLYLLSIAFTKKLDIFEQTLEKSLALENAKNHRRIAYATAQYHYEKNDFTKCIDVCNDFIKNIQDTEYFSTVKVKALKKLERFNDILELSKKLLDNNKKDFSTFVEATAILLKSGDYHQALEYSQIAHSIFPFDPKCQEYQIEALFYLGNYDNILELYKFICENNLQTEVINIFIAKTYLKQNNYKDALLTINKTLENISDKNKVWATNEKGRILEAQGKKEEAIKLYEAISNDNKTVSSITQLAKQYQSAGKGEQALEMCYEFLFKKTNVDLSEITTLAYIDVADRFTEIEYLQLLDIIAFLEFNVKKRYGFVIRLYEKSHSYSSKYFNSYYFNLGYAYRELKYFGKAIDTFKKSIEQNYNEDNVYEYINIVKIYISLKDYNKTIEACKEAIETNKTNAFFYYSYMKALNNLKKFEECIEIGISVVKNNAVKDLRNIYLHLMFALVSLKQTDKIIEYSQLFIERKQTSDLHLYNFVIFDIIATVLAKQEEEILLLRIKTYELFFEEKYSEAIDLYENLLKEKHDNLSTIILAYFYSFVDECEKGLAICNKLLFGKEFVSLEEVERIDYKNFSNKFTEKEYVRLIKQIGDFEYFLNKRYKYSTILFEKSKDTAIHIDSTHLFKLGFSYAKTDELIKGIDFFKKDIEQNFDRHYSDRHYSDNYKNIIRLYKTLDDVNSALEYCEKGIELYPNDNYFYENYYILYFTNMDRLTEFEPNEKYLVFAINKKCIDNNILYAYNFTISSLISNNKVNDIDKYTKLFLNSDLTNFTTNRIKLFSEVSPDISYDNKIKILDARVNGFNLITRKQIKEATNLLTIAIKQNYDPIIAILYSMTFEDHEEALNFCYKFMFGTTKVSLDTLKSIKYEQYKERFSMLQYYDLIYRIASIEYFQIKRYDYAYLLFEKIFDHSLINEKSLYYFMGYCCSKNKNHEKAIEYYKKNLEFENSKFDENSYNAIMDGYCELKEFENALKYSNILNDKYPQNSNYFRSKIMLLNKVGEYEQAIKVGINAVKNDNIDLLDRILLETVSASFLLDEIQPLLEIIELFARRALDTNVKNKAVLLATIAEAYIDLYYTNSVYKLKNNSNEYLDKAVSYAELSVKNLEREDTGALKFSLEGTRNCVHTLLKCYYLSGNKKKLKEISNLLTSNLSTLKIIYKLSRFTKKGYCYNYYMASFYKSIGQFKNALKFAEKSKKVKTAEKFCHFAPNCWDSYLVFGEINFMMGNYDKAIDNYKKYIEKIKFNSTIELQIKIATMLLNAKYKTS